MKCERLGLGESPAAEASSVMELQISFMPDRSTYGILGGRGRAKGMVTDSELNSNLANEDVMQLHVKESFVRFVCTAGKDLDSGYALRLYDCTRQRHARLTL